MNIELMALLLLLGSVVGVLAGLLDLTEGSFKCESQPLYAGHYPAIKDDLSVEDRIAYLKAKRGAEAPRFGT